MVNQLDILIKHARLRDRPAGLVDIAITAGHIQAIAEELPLTAGTVLEAHGNLVTESYANPHLHLCKVYTLEQMDDEALRTYQGDSMGQAMTGIELAARVKARYDAGWIVPNVRRAVRMALAHGNTHIRAFADVDRQARLEGVKALLQVRDEFKPLVNIQVVAFPQDGVVREPGAADLVRQAMELGADVVGGIPWIEYTDDGARQHIDQMFRIAREYDRPLAMLVDDAGDPGLRTLEMLAVKTIREGWQGRVLACHARAMELYPRPYFLKLAALLKEAGIGVVSDPHTGPLHACVKELLAEGALVCLGQDDISDAYYPYGRNNMLEVAFLASHLLWMMTRADMEQLYRMITVDAARAMGVADHALQVGRPAYLVVLDQPSVQEALRHHRRPVHVISAGRLVDPATLPE